VSVQMDEPELKLRFGLSLLGGALIPGHSIRQALEHPFAAGVEQPETILRLRMTQLAGASPSLQGLVEQVLLIEAKAVLPKPGGLAASLLSRLRRRIGSRGVHGSRIASL
jgi:hypothetical protein